MANFNDQDMLKKLVDALSGISGNSKYSRPVDDPANSAENALKKYETFLTDEMTIMGKYHKVFGNNWKDVLRTLSGLPKQLNRVYDEIEKDIATNNAAIDKLQKQTIDFVKSQKLNSQKIKDLAEETGKVTSDMSKYSKIHASTTALMEEYKKKEKDLREKYLKDIQDKISKEKELATAKARKDILHEEMLNDHIENLSKSIANADKELKELAEVNNNIAKQSQESGDKLVETLQKITKSKFFSALDGADQKHIEDFIKDPAQKMSDAVIHAMDEFEKVGDTIQSTLKTLVRASVDHMRNSMSSVTSQIQRMGAMALVSGKGALDTYYAQLGANQLQSTPSALIPMGMSASEQADMIKQYGREISSVTTNNDMSKAYDEQGQVLKDLQKSALLFGLIGKDAQEFSFKAVRMVNNIGAGSMTGTADTTKQLMSQISSSAAFLRTDKMELANEFSEAIESGILDTTINRIKTEGKTTDKLNDSLIKNYTALKANSVQLGYSNNYAKEQLTIALGEKYKDVGALMRGMIGGVIESNLMGKELNLTAEDKRIVSKHSREMQNMTPEELKRFNEIKIKASEWANKLDAGDFSNQMKLGIFRTMTGDARNGLLSTQNLTEGTRAGIKGESITAQSIKDANGNIIASPVLNFDKQITDAAGNLENFNNALLPFGAAESLSNLQQFMNGIGANPLGNFAGSAMGAIGGLASSAIGSAIGASLVTGGLGAASGGVIGAGLVAAAPVLGALLAAAIATVTATALASALSDAFEESKKRDIMAKDIENQTMAAASTRWQRRKEREKSGGPLEISDLYAQEYEKFTGSELKYSDDFSSAGGAISINGNNLYEPQQQAIENAVYARQIALTGNKDVLSSAKPEMRKDILREQDRLYREKLASMQKKAPNNISSVIQPSNVSPNGMVNVSNLTPSPQTNSVIQHPSVTYSDEKMQAIANIKNAAAVGGISEDTLLRMGYQESKFNPSIKNQTGSSATGLFQFTEGTWKDMMKNYGSKYGVDTTNMSDADLLELRKDSKLNALMGMEFTKQNQKIIGSETLGDTYLAHVFGAGGAKNLIAGKSPVDALGGIQKYNKIIQQNPYLAGLDSEGIRKWANEKMTQPLPTDITTMISNVPTATISAASPTPISTNLQNNVTGAINTNLANPNNNHVNIWTQMLTNLGMNNMVMNEGFNKMVETVTKGNKINEQIKQNTTPTDNDDFFSAERARVNDNIARGKRIAAKQHI